MALTDAELYDKLVRFGMMPTIAERIIQDAADADQELPTQSDVADDARITSGDIELAAQWWLYAPSVPRRFKRLLHAKTAR